MLAVPVETKEYFDIDEAQYVGHSIFRKIPYIIQRADAV